MLVMLIGYMGSGKTTLGAQLADRLAIPFIDTDAYIEELTGCSVEQLFAGRGESGFRELETEAMNELLHYDHAVIATGGGTPCIPDMMRSMLDAGKVIYLQVDPQILLARLQQDIVSRPQLSKVHLDERGAFIRTHMQAREEVYGQADITIDANKSADVVVNELMELITAQSK